MATRDELYAKFGVAAEAAQLLETDLGIVKLRYSLAIGRNMPRILQAPDR